MINSTDPGAEGYLPWTLCRKDYSHRWRTRIPSTKQALPGAVARFMEIAGVAGFLGDCRADIEIALKEALANALDHGNAYSKSKMIFVRCYAAPRMGFLIAVRDEGPGFDPEQVPDPRNTERLTLQHGRGLFLMRNLMDFIEFRKGGSEVVLFKQYRSSECDKRTRTAAE